MSVVPSYLNQIKILDYQKEHKHPLISVLFQSEIHDEILGIYILNGR